MGVQIPSMGHHTWPYSLSHDETLKELFWSGMDDRPFIEFVHYILWVAGVIKNNTIKDSAVISPPAEGCPP